ncbi:efflux RND transporter periplasmic adaptor subunit [Pseudomonas sp. Pseusp122]|uniref:efflux RND transporter periplasmic adaptor subunit n=1 Tax=unclassified Pseudomonas TaxID=196821 RepID=UPI0039A45C40
MPRHLNAFYRVGRVLRSSCCYLGFTVVVLSGCSREQPESPQTVRAVKVERVKDAVDDGLPFTGIVRQRQSAALAFESGGRLSELHVDVGDSFAAGQVLASLDRQPARLRLQQAQATARFAQARANERKSNYQRQQQLFAAGNAAQAVVQESEVAYQQALAEQSRAQSDLSLANREFERGQMIAPFAGRVVARRAERFAELTSGQIVLEVEGRDDLQIVAAVPVDQVERFKVGDSATAYKTANPSDGVELVLEGISPRADNGLLQPCIFRLRDPVAALSSGLTVLIKVNAKAPLRLSVPVQSLMPGADSSSAQLFVFQPDTGRVALRTVSISQIDNGQALISTGVASGESVVTVGTAFLSDGQAVSLFQSTSSLSRN